jgi:hypothetical protein
VRCIALTPFVPLSRLRERGNALQGAPPCAPTPLSHPVGEGLGVRAKKHKHLVCVYGAVVYIYEPPYMYTKPSYTYTKPPYMYTEPSYTYTKRRIHIRSRRIPIRNAGYIYGAVVYLYETADIYGAVVYLYETAGYIYGAIVEFLGAGRSIHGVCAG